MKIAAVWPRNGDGQTSRIFNQAKVISNLRTHPIMASTTINPNAQFEPSALGKRAGAILSAAIIEEQLVGAVVMIAQDGVVIYRRWIRGS